MKKIFKTILSLVLVGLTAFGLASCGEQPVTPTGANTPTAEKGQTPEKTPSAAKDPTKEATCTHDWVKGTETPADCTNAKKTLYTCSKCNETKTEPTGNPLGHDYQKDATSVEATCTTEGTLVEKCTRCNDTTTTPVKVLTHEVDTDNYCSHCHQFLLPASYVNNLATSFNEGVNVTVYFTAEEISGAVSNYTLSLSYNVEAGRLSFTGDKITDFEIFEEYYKFVGYYQDGVLRFLDTDNYEFNEECEKSTLDIAGFFEGENSYTEVTLDNLKRILKFEGNSAINKVFTMAAGQVQALTGVNITPFTESIAAYLSSCIDNAFELQELPEYTQTDLALALAKYLQSVELTPEQAEALLTGIVGEVVKYVTPPTEGETQYSFALCVRAIDAKLKQLGFNEAFIESVLYALVSYAHAPYESLEELGAYVDLLTTNLRPLIPVLEEFVTEPSSANLAKTETALRTFFKAFGLTDKDIDGLVAKINATIQGYTQDETLTMKTIALEYIELYEYLTSEEGQAQIAEIIEMAENVYEYILGLFAPEDDEIEGEVVEEYEEILIPSFDELFPVEYDVNTAYELANMLQTVVKVTKGEEGLTYNLDLTKPYQALKTYLKSVTVEQLLNQLLETEDASTIVETLVCTVLTTTGSEAETMVEAYLNMTLADLETMANTYLAQFLGEDYTVLSLFKEYVPVEVNPKYETLAAFYVGEFGNKKIADEIKAFKGKTSIEIQLIVKSTLQPLWNTTLFDLLLNALGETVTYDVEEFEMTEEVLDGVFATINSVLGFMVEVNTDFTGKLTSFEAGVGAYGIVVTPYSEDYDKEIDEILKPWISLATIGTTTSLNVYKTTVDGQEVDKAIYADETKKEVIGVTKSKGNLEYYGVTVEKKGSCYVIDNFGLYVDEDGNDVDTGSFKIYVNAEGVATLTQPEGTYETEEKVIGNKIIYITTYEGYGNSYFYIENMDRPVIE